MRTALVLTLLALPQEPSLDELVRRLADDRIAVRREAVEALVALGPGRLPELRARRDGLDPEARLLLGEAVSRIEAAVRFRDFLPEYRPVSLSFEKVPGRRALAEWSERTGIAVDAEAMDLPRDVTLRADGLPPLEALNLICREAMVGWRLQGKTDWRGRAGGKGPERVVIHRVTPYYHRPLPVAYVRHYRLRVADAGTTDVRSLAIQIQTAPGVRPHSHSGLRIREAGDEEGRDLREALSVGAGGFFRLRPGETGARVGAGFRPPDPRPRRIARLVGSVTFRYPRELRWIHFDRPHAARGATAEALGCRFVLEGYARRGKEHEVNLSFTRSDGAAMRGDLERDLPFDYTEVELVTASGERLTSSGCSGGGGRLGWGIRLTMTGSSDEEAAAIRVPWADRFVEDVVDFELRDIPLS